MSLTAYWYSATQAEQLKIEANSDESSGVGVAEYARKLGAFAFTCTERFESQQALDAALSDRHAKGLTLMWPKENSDLSKPPKVYSYPVQVLYVN